MPNRIGLRHDRHRRSRPGIRAGDGNPGGPGGLSTRDLLEILRIVFRDLPVRALDLVEVSPPLDASDITSFAAIKLIYEAFGWVLGRRGN